MSARYLGFVLVIWLPGAMQAPSSSQSCDAPSLDGGFFHPGKISFPHGSELSYACETGFKPAAEGWWAKSSCQDGKWVPEPQCVDEQACPLPEIPNVKSIEKQSLWYENGSSIWITCDEGYEVKNSDSTVVCSDGKWSPEPVCDKSDQACAAPPKIQHAIIVAHRYQEVFADNSRLQYECKAGFTVLEGTESEKTITCRSGEWTEGPECRSSSRPDGNSRPALIRVEECGNPPTIENGDVVYVDQMYLRYKCKNFYKLVGPESLKCNSDGSWSELPVCKEAFCAVDPDQFSLDRNQYPGTIYIHEGTVEDIVCGRELYRRFSCTNGAVTYTSCSRPGAGHASTTGERRRPVPVARCGDPPNVRHAEVDQSNPMFLSYDCDSYHKLEGPLSVLCYSDGTWSDLPTCRPAYCTVDTASERNLINVGVQFIKEGETTEFKCKDQWVFNNYSVGKCIEGQLTLSSCCNRAQISTGVCRFVSD